ncbi:hypothetical protein SAMN06297280_3438 [Arsukibacterium tuosuense]|uniref:Uncharacterized protein n=1 Tax=Arsukibacterium tuosuense TaxID=1323745 RepID=A0A285JHG6_9GAMM|nr:hypothetical protein SAMN06297280_3438 [Arsukibacterium tuosuense]
MYISTQVIGAIFLVLTIATLLIGLYLVKHYNNKH